MRGSGKGGTKICNVTNKSERSSMSAHAMVSCGRCGAMAHDPTNVCDPVQYPIEGTLGD
jgi:hypothetical protein